MNLATIIAAFALFAPAPVDDPVKCAVMGSPVKETAPAVEYAGIKFPTCCAGCTAPLLKTPTKYLKTAAESGTTIAMSLFCPVSGEKLDWTKVEATTDYKGVRYGFCRSDCKEAFAKDSAKYATAPKKESLVCVVSGEKISSYSAASGFVDHEGVRYYLCCDGCAPAMKKDPAGTLAKGKGVVTEPVAMNSPKKKQS